MTLSLLLIFLLQSPILSSPAAVAVVVVKVVAVVLEVIALAPGLQVEGQALNLHLPLALIQITP
jgi:hypothetical protein